MTKKTKNLALAAARREFVAADRAPDTDRAAARYSAAYDALVAAEAAERSPGPRSSGRRTRTHLRRARTRGCACEETHADHDDICERERGDVSMLGYCAACWDAHEI